MSWTPVVSGPASWGTPSTSAAIWATQSRHLTPPSWGMFSSLTTTADQGVDFRLIGRNEFPMLAGDERPVVAWNIEPEGQP